jgi:hypothetical protein
VVNISWYYAMLFQIFTEGSLTERLLRVIKGFSLLLRTHMKVVVSSSPIHYPSQRENGIPKKIHGKADTRALIGAEIAEEELNVHEREQRLREREQLAIDLTLDNGSDIPRIAMKPPSSTLDLIVTASTEKESEEILLVRATPSPREDPPVDKEAENPHALPASTAPALLQTNG